ncbi:amphiregulin [Thalassophryne amazonica]|uniref:amphiregulin n=1 Tax=Thalassophryne amazonica TaxID=390379 RepID=UPI001471AF8C|nr:amphiregulin [Thalassophryne amazonica]XP_034026669.1 amphiregulin [Thalassophryne amazonica]
MNTLIPTCLLCFVVCSTQGSEASLSVELSTVTGGPASDEALEILSNNDDELDVDEELSGGSNTTSTLHESYISKDEAKKRKGKSRKKNKQKSKSTTASNPKHTFNTSGFTSAVSTGDDPCTSTHLGYCIHGYCKYMEGLQEPVCICMKGYDGERCGIQTLETNKGKDEQHNNAELVQTVLVIIAVVLSVISCTAILLMTCTHYRSQKNFLAAYLGTGTEQEKLQKPINDVTV